MLPLFSQPTTYERLVLDRTDVQDGCMALNDPPVPFLKFPIGNLKAETVIVGSGADLIGKDWHTCTEAYYPAALPEGLKSIHR